MMLFLQIIMLTTQLNGMVYIYDPYHLKESSEFKY